VSLNPDQWHARYTQQARWTKELRNYLLQRAGMENARFVLEVGCGSGAVLSGIGLEFNKPAFGLDIDDSYLTLAARNTPSVKLLQGDANFLPLKKAHFDITFCHFLLLWVRDPTKIVSEMIRITKSGGAVLALAEPDYGGRIDYPPKLSHLGALQTEALKRQGADPLIGRRLAEIFITLGLVNVETGILGAQWKNPPSPANLQTEWAVLESDLSGFVSKSDIQEFKKEDADAWSRGDRILYVPTFYSWGRVP